jgi:hypothetical protein
MATFIAMEWFHVFGPVNIRHAPLFVMEGRESERGNFHSTHNAHLLPVAKAGLLFGFRWIGSSCARGLLPISNLLDYCLQWVILLARGLNGESLQRGA